MMTFNVKDNLATLVIYADEGQDYHNDIYETIEWSITSDISTKDYLAIKKLMVMSFKNLYIVDKQVVAPVEVKDDKETQSEAPTVPPIKQVRTLPAMPKAPAYSTPAPTPTGSGDWVKKILDAVEQGHTGFTGASKPKFSNDMAKARKYEFYDWINDNYGKNVKLTSLTADELSQLYQSLTT